MYLQGERITELMLIVQIVSFICLSPMRSCRPLADWHTHAAAGSDVRTQWCRDTWMTFIEATLEFECNKMYYCEDSTMNIVPALLQGFYWYGKSEN